MDEDKSLMSESANKSSEGEQNAKQKDEVYEVPKSESNTLRENCVQRERKQFMESERF